jgi:hypothetical protein
MSVWKLKEMAKEPGFALPQNDGLDGPIDFAGQYERQCGLLAHPPGRAPNASASLKNLVSDTLMVAAPLSNPIICRMHFRSDGYVLRCVPTRGPSRRRGRLGQGPPPGGAVRAFTRRGYDWTVRAGSPSVAELEPDPQSGKRTDATEQYRCVREHAGIP